MTFEIIECFNKKTAEFIDGNWSNAIGHKLHRQQIEDLMIFAYNLGKQEVLQDMPTP